MPAKRPPDSKMVALGKRILNLASAPQQPKIKLPTNDLVEVKVTLNEVDPPVWRKLIIRADSSLEELHLAIQKSMGWQNCHLYDFFVNYVDKKLSANDMPYLFGNEEDCADPSGVTIEDLLFIKFEDIQYNYDYGDCWEHTVEIGNVVLPQSGTTYPICTEGAGACPPEDCGGPHGYMNLCAILSNPKDEEYKEMRQWLGKGFDPSKFSVAKANKELRSKSW